MNIRVNFENGKVDWRQDTYDICGQCSKYNSYNRTQEKKKKKKSLIEELTTLKVKIRSAKFATGNEIKGSRRLQKLFENTEENVLELLSLIVPVMRESILAGLKLPVSIRFLFTGATFTD